MSKPAAGLTSLANIARRVKAAQPLDYTETFDLHRLRQCKLHVPETFASEREELDALRAELERELAEVRALTEKDSPLSYAVDPVTELYWRRPLATKKREADEAAQEEKARKKRETDEERHTYARQKRQADEKEAEEDARLKREADEERRTYARQKRQHDKRIAEEAHLTLSAPELAWQEHLRKDWTDNGMLKGPEVETFPPIWSCPGDCGRKHSCDSAACACSNVRRGEADQRPGRRRPGRRRPGRRRPARRRPARPRRPGRNVDKRDRS